MKRLLVVAVLVLLCSSAKSFALSFTDDIGGGGSSVGGGLSGSTPCGVLFGGSGTTLAQDATNLCFDDANNRLGIGTSSPATKLHISSGSLTLDGTSPAVTVGTLSVGASYGLQVKSDLGALILSPNFSVDGNTGGYINLQAAAGSMGISAVGLDGDKPLLLGFNGKPVGVGGLSAAHNTLDVGGGVVVGGNYASVSTAPANGLLVQGSVGIGTTAPSTKLHMSSGVFTIDGTGPGIAVGVSTFVVVDGRVGIGTTSPNASLQIVGGRLVVPTGSSASPSITFSGSGLYEDTSPSGALTVVRAGSEVLTVDTNQTLFRAGTVAAPGIAGLSDTNTGISLLGADVLAASTAGAERLRVSAGGSVGIGNTAPATKLHMSSGVITLDGSGAGINVATSAVSGYMVNILGPVALQTDPTWGGTEVGFYRGATGLGGLYFDNAASYVDLYASNEIKISGSGGLTATANAGGFIVPDGKYFQATDNNAGAPPAGDCDDDSEYGRISLDTANERLYVCNGAARGWDYVPLTD
jgi:hypothetical protein